MKNKFLFFHAIGSVCILVLLLFLPAAVLAQGPDLPDGYMSAGESAKIIAKTLTITLHPDLSPLSPAERGTASRIIEAGGILHKLYEQSLHHQARAAYEALVETDEGLGSPVGTRNLMQLYYLFKGPIIRDLDDEYVPILPVDNKVPGRNVYPWGIVKDEVDKFIGAHPGERKGILELRTVVRRTERDAVRADIDALERYPVLDILHPGLKERLNDLEKSKSEEDLYVVPYSVAYANDLMRVYSLLQQAAAIIRAEDAEFARFLSHRAVDILRDDYEAGDAAWVRGKFKHLNAQIGSYEVYDDELYAVKTFFSLSLLIKDLKKSADLESALTGFQELEDALPYQYHKKVQENIPVGVYNVIADFGQSRGANTATILPNESYLARKYGRIILIRQNIISNPELYSISRTSWKAAVMDRHFDDYKADGNFYRTLWHEIGHYLGPDLAEDGRTLGEALQEYSQVLEELKADLVSLFLTKPLEKRGYYSVEQVRSVYASGIRRVLLKNQPKKGQTYQTMELMQMNYFLEHGLLEFDKADGRFGIAYDKYNDVIAGMLGEVLALQYSGDKKAAGNFIRKYGSWHDDIQGIIASRMIDTEKYRYVMVHYSVLEN